MHQNGIHAELRTATRSSGRREQWNDASEHRKSAVPAAEVIVCLTERVDADGELVVTVEDMGARVGRGECGAIRRHAHAKAKIAREGGRQPFQWFPEERL